MALGEPIKFRLTPEKHAQYEDEAARLGKPLGTYLRERLEADDAVRDELAELRREVVGLHRAVEDLAGEGPRAGGGDEGTKAVMLEVLLLLRAVAGADKLKMAQGELKRLEHEIWTPGEAQR